jgi:hypothetical protein
METATDTYQNRTRNLWLSRIIKFQVIIAVLTIVISIIVGFQITPLIKQKAQLESEVKQKNDELEKLRADLDETNEKLKKAAPLLNMSGDDVSVLKEVVPNLSQDELKGASLNFIVEQCHKAITELQKIKSITPEKRRRSTITIRFYPREIDRDRVTKAQKALEEHGFKFEISEKPKELTTPTNAIWLVSKDVMAEDVKLIAYNLIRFGIQVKFIGPFPNPELLESLRDKRIHVGAEPKVISSSPLTVDEIRDLSLDQMKAGVKN